MYKVPAEMTEIVPYSAEKYPQVFEHRETLVRTATAERTFWEKLTILHMVAHFPEGKVFPARYFRHYYDVFCYCKNGYKHRVFEHKDLLENVAQFKEKFYPSSVAQYELARIGSLKLVPPGHISTPEIASRFLPNILIFGQKGLPHEQTYSVPSARIFFCFCRLR